MHLSLDQSGAASGEKTLILTEGRAALGQKGTACPAKEDRGLKSARTVPAEEGSPACATHNKLPWVLLPALPSVEPHPLPSLLAAPFGKVRSLARTATKSKDMWLTAA